VWHLYPPFYILPPNMTTLSGSWIPPPWGHIWGGGRSYKVSHTIHRDHFTPSASWTEGFYMRVSLAANQLAVTIPHMNLGVFDQLCGRMAEMQMHRVPAQQAGAPPGSCGSATPPPSQSTSNCLPRLDRGGGGVVSRCAANPGLSSQQFLRQKLDLSFH